MTRSVLLAYQWLTGVSDSVTGALLCGAPIMTLRLMGIHAPEESAPYIAYIGAFVFSVGVACLYGARLMAKRASAERIEMVWLLTAFSRSAVAIYIVAGVLGGNLEMEWLPVAAFDAVCVMVQSIGLRKGWIAHAF